MKAMKVCQWYISADTKVNIKVNLEGIKANQHPFIFCCINYFSEFWISNWVKLWT